MFVFTIVIVKYVSVASIVIVRTQQTRHLIYVDIVVCHVITILFCFVFDVIRLKQFIVFIVCLIVIFVIIDILVIISIRYESFVFYSRVGVLLATIDVFVSLGLLVVMIIVDFVFRCIMICNVMLVIRFLVVMLIMIIEVTVIYVVDVIVVCVRVLVVVCECFNVLA